MSLLNIDRARSLKDRINEAADPTVGALVAKYGTDVNRLKIDTAAGKVNPTNAVMAMMMIQRIVASQTQPPSGTTVAQDTGVAPPPQAGLSAMAPQGAPGANPVRMAYGGQVAVSNNQVPSPAMERGISGLPVPDNMFDYADGGMIAFAGGGDVQRFQNQGAVRLGQPSDLRLAGFTWDQLPVEDSGMYGPMTRGISELFSRPMNQRKKRDPNTGEYITYSEFIERAAQPQRGAMPQNMSPDMQKYLQQFERGRETMTAPPGADATGRPKIDPFVNRTANQGQTQANKEAVKQAVATTGLSSTVPSLPPAQSGQTGDFAVSPEERARGLVSMAGLPKLEAITDEAALERIRAVEEKSGVDPRFFEKLQNRIDTMREEAKTDKKEAANMRLLEAGLNILGGSSPYAFVNIGKGASEAVKGFGQDLKDYQKARRELDKSEMELKSAEQTAARTKSATALNMVERRQDKVDAAKTKEAELYSTAVNSFYQLDEKAKGRISGENISMAQLQARRDEVRAQLAMQNRQIDESRQARLEAAGLAADQRFVEGLTRAEKAATDSYDARIKAVETSMSNQTAALTPDFLLKQQQKIDELVAKRAAAANLAREKYMEAYRTGRPTQNNAALSAADRIAGIGK
jgi:hypothetical protein